VEIEEAKAKLLRLQEYAKTELTMADHDGHSLDVVAASAKFSQNLPKLVSLMRTYVEQATGQRSYGS
jgi:GTP-binding protein